MTPGNRNDPIGALHRVRGVTLLAALAIVQAACASAPPPAPYARPAPKIAMPAGPGGAFAVLESGIRAAHGPEASGFELIDRNEDGLRWRLPLIDSARQSIDVQYYLWYGDAAGRLVA
jgi:putative cardiolipin synthase